MGLASATASMPLAHGSWRSPEPNAWVAHGPAQAISVPGDPELDTRPSEHVHNGRTHTGAAGFRLSTPTPVSSLSVFAFSCPNDALSNG